MDTQQNQCQDFINACLQKRVSPDKFRALFITFHDKNHRIQSRRLLDFLVKQSTAKDAVDPRAPLYIKEILQLRVCSLADVLSSLLPPEREPSTEDSFHDQALLEIGNAPKPTLQAVVFQMLIMEVSEGLLKTKEEVKATLKALMKWMSILPGSTTLGYLVSAILGTTIVQETLTQTSTKGFKKAFGHAFSRFITRLMQTNMQVATALDFWQKQYNLAETDVAQRVNENYETANLGSYAFQESVLETPSVTARAGMYVHLNAVIHARPLFDDSTVLHYLNARYKGDVTTLVIDLIVASFDVLANAMYRSEPAESLMLHRSYLVNKLPIFLLNYAGMMFEPMNIEYCISQAFAHIDPTAFPSFSQMFDLLGRNSVSEARQEFLFACALHQLIPEQSIEGLLGDVPMQSLPAGGRYMKQDLVTQCTANPSRIDELVGELENMEGNAGEIAGAMLEIMQTLCSNNDTMTMKGLCNALSRRMGAMDVLMLFTNPEQLLRPLCNTLDNWQIHEDQGENQPVYDEFGSILLFVVLAVHRFDLQRQDLGISSSNTFLFRYTREASAAKDLNELTEKESKLLGAWVRGLFEENEGINDELMAASSPNDFHMLVATLLDQSLKACQAGFLAMSTLKDGLEYLLEPFLLPSLIGGLTFMAHKIWETTESATTLDILLPALATLIKPRSISTDSAAVHSAVLSMVAKPLDDALRHAQRRHPRRADINPLLESVKPHMQKQRRDVSAFTELESWSVVPGGSLSTALRHTLQTLIHWSSPTSTELSPPHYTHRQIYLTLQVVGANTVLNALIDELLLHVANIDIALDVVVTMISSPLAGLPQPTSTDPAFPPPRRQLSIRDALRMQSEHAYELSKKDMTRASMIVRLQRRVEALVGQGQDGTQGVEGDAAALGMDAGMGAVVTLEGSEVVKNAEGLPTVDIDDVLEQATDEQMAVSDFMAGGGRDDFMNLG